MNKVLAVLILSAACLAQTAPPKPDVTAPKAIPALNDAEKVPILSAQKLLFQKYTAYLQAKDALTAAESDTQKASAALISAWGALLEARHLKQGDVLICDGPTTAGCEKVAAGDIALLPKPEAKK